MQKQIPPASGKRINVQPWTPKPGNDVTDKYKRGTFVNIHICKKDSDGDMYSLAD